MLCPQAYSADAEQSLTIVCGVGWGCGYGQTCLTLHPCHQLLEWSRTLLALPGRPRPSSFWEGMVPIAMSESWTCSIFSPHGLVPRRAGDAGPCPARSGRSAGPMSPRDAGSG